MPSAEPILIAHKRPQLKQQSTFRREFLLCFTLTVSGCALWMWHYLLRGWVPHDDGSYAEAALRVLRGELPHRDFLEIYTGGLAFLNAAAFRLFGFDFASLRYPLFAFAVLWVAAFFFIASRLVSPALAALVTFIAVLWSVPNYPAAVPSWYNLFFATFGIVALLRYRERGNRAWVFAAGVCGGLSFLAKLSGIFFVAAALLFLWYEAQTKEAVLASKERPFSRMAPRLRIAGALVMALLVFRVIAGWLTVETAANFIAPPLLMCGVIVARDLRSKALSNARLLRRMLIESALCLAGFLLPVTCFLLIYVDGGLLDWIKGVFVYPARRLEFAKAPPPELLGLVVAAAAWLFFSAVILGRRRWIPLVAVSVLVYVGARSFRDENAFEMIWLSLAAFVPVAALVAYFLCVQPPPSMEREPREYGQTIPTENSATEKNARIYLLATVTAFCSLVQFPFAAPIYFTYIAPLLILCLVAMFASATHTSRLGTAVVLAFYLWVGIAQLRPANLFTIGYFYTPDQNTAVLNLEGARHLRVLPPQARLYQQLVATVREHARGEYIYAMPSAPELYYLTGHRNPCRWLFDFFDPSARDVGTVGRILDQQNVQLVVINYFPSFDPSPSPAMVKMLRERYPKSQRIQNGLLQHWEVRWRE